jgi:hypothetical protein
MSKKTVAIYLVITALFFGVAAIAFAQDTPPVDPTFGDAFNAAKDIVVNWKQVGILASVVALVNLLMLLLRIPMINDWFESKGIKWVKAWVAPGLGAVAAVLAAIVTGAGWEVILQAGAAGLISGLASVGTHQMVTKSNDTDKTEYIATPAVPK